MRDGAVRKVSRKRAARSVIVSGYRSPVRSRASWRALSSIFIAIASFLFCMMSFLLLLSAANLFVNCFEQSFHMHDANERGLGADQRFAVGGMMDFEPTMSDGSQRDVDRTEYKPVHGAISLRRSDGRCWADTGITSGPSGLRRAKL